MNRQRTAIAGVIGLGLLLGIGAWSILGKPNSQSNGTLTVEPQNLTVTWSDEIESGKSQFVEFTLTNRGTDPVRILDISSNCGCTVAQLPALQVLPPDGQSRMQAKVTLPNYGERTSRLLIRTDSKEYPNVPVELILKGKELKVPYATGWPMELQFQGDEMKEMIEEEIEVSTMEDKESPPWIKSVSLSFSNGTAEILESNTGGGLSHQSISRSYRIRLSLPVPRKEEERLFGSLTPILSEPGQRPIRPVRISTSLKPSIRVLPRELLISMPANQNSVDRKIIFLGNVAEPIEIEVEKATVDWIMFDQLSLLQDQRPTTELLIHVLRPPALLEQETGEIVVNISRPVNRRLKIPVTVVSR